MKTWDTDENGDSIPTEQLNNNKEDNKKMEQTNVGNIGIGTKEMENTKLEPKTLKIVSYEIKPIESVANDKVEFEVKHPDREDNIKISSVAFLADKKVKTSGTWMTLDDEGNIQKGCALAQLLGKIGAANLKEVKDKTCESELDAKGYLCFKAY